jgi:hypothetical protein
VRQPGDATDAGVAQSAGHGGHLARDCAPERTAAFTARRALQGARFNGVLFEVQRALQTFGQLCVREQIPTLRKVYVLEMLSNYILVTQSFDVGVFNEKVVGLGLINKTLSQQTGVTNSAFSRNHCLAGNCLLPISLPECRKLPFRNQTIMSKQSDAFR